ncbi:hypothetical protein CEXT_491951 [Caerostris extrusa]|uniref:Uncharacterized protein n=1 Tax=Caerostris extrusa TaxID=172846 RepID=A0AAV4SRW9_CAEEX|nr:hypothetical protein CEXT_491951 [Caerostris extrusa]
MKEIMPFAYPHMKTLFQTSYYSRFPRIWSNITPEHPIKSLCFLNSQLKWISYGRRKARDYVGVIRSQQMSLTYAKLKVSFAMGQIHALSIKIKN